MTGYSTNEFAGRPVDVSANPLTHPATVPPSHCPPTGTVRPVRLRPDLFQAGERRPRWWPALAAALLVQAAGAEEVPEWPALRLQSSGQLLERLPEQPGQGLPTFVYGDTLQGQTGVGTRIEGHAELRRHDTVLRADRLEHLEPSDTAIATGNVRINRMGDVYEGPELRLKLDTFEGHFLQPRYELLKNRAHGEAERLDFLGKDRAVAHQASYTTCRRPSAGSRPDWAVTASRIDFDHAEETGTAINGVLRFKGVPILGAPYVSFPLSDRRKSGALPPTINIDNQSGLEVTLPYYLNLAPHFDATLYPTVMSKRGIDLAGEFRYLERGYGGQLRGAYMPSDKLRNEDRWAASVQHQQVFSEFAGLGRVGLRLDLNRVSDDNYWRDFPRTSTSLTSRLLASEAVLSWHGGDWAVSAGAHRWQTLQDVDAPIVAPYDRLPSLSARYAPSAFALAGLDGWRGSLLTELTHFRTERAPSANDFSGTRFVAVASLGRTWQTPGWYVRPELQLHARHYRFGPEASHLARSTGYAIPSLSIDSGLVLERDASYFGRSFLQTLEPRLYYVHTPYRDQSFLPAYDSAAYDFNLATIYNRNPYAGHDRIADMNTLTFGMTSRLLDPDTGAEVLNVGVAQRVRLDDQQVTLPGETPVTERLSDILFGARVNWNAHWSANASVQFNPKARESVRTTLGARYSPGNYRVVSAAYRLQRGTSEQFDIGWQWPLSDLFGSTPPGAVPGQALGPNQWYSVGRINYSVPDRRIVDLIAGFEYDAGCWIGRLVLERLQQSRSSANQRILFQIEFTGFTRLGSNPLQTLKDNVPRYQYLREQVNPPSRFERYD